MAGYDDWTSLEDVATLISKQEDSETIYQKNRIPIAWRGDSSSITMEWSCLACHKIVVLSNKLTGTKAILDIFELIHADGKDNNKDCIVMYTLSSIGG